MRMQIVVMSDLHRDITIWTSRARAKILQVYRARERSYEKISEKIRGVSNNYLSQTVAATNDTRLAAFLA